jgi:hypothetical protein
VEKQAASSQLFFNHNKETAPDKQTVEQADTTTAELQTPADWSQRNQMINFTAWAYATAKRAK